MKPDHNASKSLLSAGAAACGWSNPSSDGPRSRPRDGESDGTGRIQSTGAGSGIRPDENTTKPDFLSHNAWPGLRCADCRPIGVSRTDDRISTLSRGEAARNSQRA